MDFFIQYKFIYEQLGVVICNMRSQYCHFFSCDLNFCRSYYYYYYDDGDDVIFPSLISLVCRFLKLFDGITDSSGPQAHGVGWR